MPFRDIEKCREIMYSPHRVCSSDEMSIKQHVGQISEKHCYRSKLRQIWRKVKIYQKSNSEQRPFTSNKI